jgi:hypothetical protein
MVREPGTVELHAGFHAAHSGATAAIVVGATS